jgi:hypothetical protein
LRSIGIIKTQLTKLELDAQRIEANVARALDYMGRPSKKADQYTPKEAKIMDMLYRLDELQEQIDELMAELKEAGGYTVYSYAGNVYEYKRPKVVAPVKEKRPEWVERKEYSTKTTAQQKREAAQAAKKAAREAKGAAQLAEREAAKALREAARAAVRAEKESAALAAKQAREAARQAARAAREASKPVRVAKPVRVVKPKATPKPKQPPKSRELQRAERGVYDAILDRQKVEGVFERQRIKDQQWAEEAQADLIRYADTPTKENGHQLRSRARIKLAAATERLNTIEERKEARYRELDERQARYEAEVRDLNANGSQKSGIIEVGTNA